MDKAKFYNTLKDRIEDYLCTETFELNDNEYYDKVTAEFEDVEELSVEVELRITGYNHHDRGDYYTPPEDSGVIYADVLELTAWDSEDNEVLSEKNVSELSTKIEY